MRGIVALLWILALWYWNFAELLKAEVQLPRTPLPRRWVHSRRLGLLELGLAIAELRQVQLDLRDTKPHGLLDRGRVLLRALEDLDGAEERARGALRLWKDAD